MQLDPKKLAKEYRPHMPVDVLHLWAKDVVAYLNAAPSPSPAPGVDGPEEERIDGLRLQAFKTNSNEDKAAYYLAVSKWFQDRHFRALASLSQPAKGEREGERS